MKKITITLLIPATAAIAVFLTQCRPDVALKIIKKNLDTVVKTNQVVKFSFVPNQIAANAWYKPGGTLVNGHLDESFGNQNWWPVLISNLQRTGGSFSLFAAEVGHMSSANGLIPLLKAKGIPISVELPGFTQCIDGTPLGQAELNGQPVNGMNIFSQIFVITNTTDRIDPNNRGWFVTKDTVNWVPDEILFDERQPNLLPQIDPDKLATTPGTWDDRKTAAKINNGCPVTMGNFDAGLESLRQDYAKFLNVAKAKWGANMPAASVHWNVNPGWEWRDQRGLDSINAHYPTYFFTPANYWGIVQNYPQYNSVQYLNSLVDVMTTAGFKPKTVLMDVDWRYNVPYITEVLMRHKTALKAKGVQMGINIVDASMTDDQELYLDGATLSTRTVAGANPNVLYEHTLLAIMQFLINSGIYEDGMQLRVGSWSHRPYETGSAIAESNPGAMAHTANQIIQLLNW